MLGNLGESLKGTVAGVGMLIASFPVLFYNEGCAVDIAKGLEEGLAIVESIDPAKSVANFNGKLIHANGNAEAGSTISDPEFGVEVKALGLSRGVSMYQWEESVSEDDKKNKTYRYSKTWSSSHIDSSRFNEPTGHENPAMLYNDKEFSPTSVSMGNLLFSQSLIDSIPVRETYSYDSATVSRIRAKFGKESQVADGNIYLGANPSAPEIGDVQITHQIAPEGAVSIVGLLNGSTVNSYTTKRKTSILMFEYGTKDAGTMFQDAQDANVMRTWLVRIGGMFLMFLGFRGLFGPIAAVGGMIPILGSILNFGLSLVSGVLAFSLSFVTISIAWIFYRPFVGIPLLLIGVGAFAYLYYLKDKQKASPQTQS